MSLQQVGRMVCLLFSTYRFPLYTCHLDAYSLTAGACKLAANDPKCEVLGGGAVEMDSNWGREAEESFSLL